MKNTDLKSERNAAAAAAAAGERDTAHDEEDPPIPPQVEQRASASSTATGASDKVESVVDDNSASEGETGIDLQTIDDEEAPIHPSSFEIERQKSPKKDGDLEQDLDSEPHRESLAAMEQDDSLLKGSKEPVSASPRRGWSPRSLLGSIAPLPSSVEPVLLSPPVPERTDLDDDSSDASRAKVARLNTRRLDSVTEPNPEDESDAQPTITVANTRNMIRQVAPNPIPQTPALTPSTTITADVQSTSPYVNERDEVCIPEATLVTSQREMRNEDIPAATVVRPEKYSLTIAGRKIPLYLLVLGVIVVLIAVIALAVTLSGGEDNTPSSAPSISLFPTSVPSMQPSTSPTSVLQANLMNIISEYSGGNVSSSFSEYKSNHRMALNWLVDDQSKWLEEKEPLSSVEIVERFVLALLHFETGGDDWREPFKFRTEEHICMWKGRLYRTFSKGVTACTHGNVRRVTNLTLCEYNI